MCIEGYVCEYIYIRAIWSSSRGGWLVLLVSQIWRFPAWCKSLCIISSVNVDAKWCMQLWFVPSCWLIWRKTCEVKLMKLSSILLAWMCIKGYVCEQISRTYVYISSTRGGWLLTLVSSQIWRFFFLSYNKFLLRWNLCNSCLCRLAGYPEELLAGMNFWGFSSREVS